MSMNQPNQPMSEWVILCGTKPYPFTLNAAGEPITQRFAELMGYSMIESTGAAAATVNIYNGADASGQLVATIALASGASTTKHFGDLGVECDTGLYVDVATGSVKGSIWFRQ